MQRINLILLMTMTLFHFFTISVYAEEKDYSGCLEIENSSDWSQIMNEMVDDISNKRYDDAEVKSEILDGFCAKSPVLNYMKAQIAEGKNDLPLAKKYYQTACDNMNDMTPSENVAAIILKKCNETAILDPSDSAFIKYELTTNPGDIQNNKIDANLVIAQLEWRNQFKEHARKSMWAGAGVGIGGLVLMATGVGLYITGNDYEMDANGMILDGFSSVKYGPKKETADNLKFSGLVLSSLGSSLLFIGALVTGIYGYWYTHADDDDVYSFDIHPGSLSFSMKF